MALGTPNFPVPPRDYVPEYFDQVWRMVRSWMLRDSLEESQTIETIGVSINDLKSATTPKSPLHIGIDSLPTEASFATLTPGDVYRDSTTNILKIKP